MLALLMGVRHSALFWTGVSIAGLAAFAAMEALGAGPSNQLALHGTTLLFQRVVDVATWIAILATVP